MYHRSASKRRSLHLVAICVVLFPLQAAAGTPPGKLPIAKILFLGNSITLHPPLPERGWHGNWGMAASALEKDYVHQLADQLNERTAGVLRLTLVDPAHKNADGSPNLLDANVVNIADILERNYASYDDGKLKAQVAAQPDLVVLQCGENVQMDSFDAAAFANSLRKLVGGLKKSSDPAIFVTSTIYGPKPELDQIKQQIVAEAPERRVFVDLSGFRTDPKNNGFLDHPSDQGMKYIADTLFKAIQSRAELAVPKPVD